MAALGGYTLLNMIESQATTVAELDQKYEQLVADVRAEGQAQLATQRQAFEGARMETNAVNKRQQGALATIVAQLESNKTQLVETQGELADLQKDVKTEAGRRYRGDINAHAKINRVSGRVTALERRSSTRR